MKSYVGSIADSLRSPTIPRPSVETGDTGDSVLGGEGGIEVGTESLRGGYEAGVCFWRSTPPIDAFFRRNRFVALSEG